MRFLSLFVSALALTAASASRKGSTDAARTVRLAQTFETIELVVNGFSQQCAEDFVLQNDLDFQTSADVLLAQFAENCVPPIAAVGPNENVVATDPCTAIAQTARNFGNNVCPTVEADLCALTVAESLANSIDSSSIRTVYTYYLCVPSQCSSVDVEDAFSQVFDALSDDFSVAEGRLVFDRQDYTGALFCGNQDGFPRRFGSGFALELDVTGTSTALNTDEIIIQSPLDGAIFSVSTTVVPGIDGPIYANNAAAELNADNGFRDAGCLAYYRTEPTIEDSRLFIFCEDNTQIYASDGGAPQLIQEFSGLGFDFSGEAEMEDFETPTEGQTNAPIITTAGPQQTLGNGVLPPIPTLDNGASAMAPTMLVAAASLVVAALAL